MIPSLPTELLHQIFDSICQPPLHFSSYKQRQFTLRSLCLTSRLFRSIAQPLLIGDLIWVESEASLIRTLDRFQAVGGGPMIQRLVLVDGDRASVITNDSVKRAMLVCPNLSNLSLNVYGIKFLETVQYIRRIDTDLWASMSQLTSLRFSVDGAEFNPPIALSKLCCLQLAGTSVLDLQNLLSPALLPSLRHLSLSTLRSRPPIELSKDVLLLFQQVDLISVDVYFWNNHFDTLEPFSSKTVLECPLNVADSNVSLLSTAQYLNFIDIEQATFPVKLSLILAVFDKSIRLRSIHLGLLPPFHSPPLFDQTQLVAEALEILTALCRREGIEVQRYEQASENYIDERFYEDFMRRRRNDETKK